MDTTPPASKGGRPSKAQDAKRSEVITFKTTPGQLRALRQRADTLGMTLSDYCHRHILSTTIVAPFTEEELTLKRGLVGMANNVNQLAYKAHAAGIESVAESCREVLAELRKELAVFKKYDR